MIHGCPDCAPSMPCEKHEAREAAEAQVAQLTREKAELLSCPDHGPHLGFRYCPECYAKAFTEGQAASALHSQQLEQLRDVIAPFRHTPEDAELWTEPEAFIREVRELRGAHQHDEAVIGELQAHSQQMREALEKIASEVEAEGKGCCCHLSHEAIPASEHGEPEIPASPPSDTCCGLRRERIVTALRLAALTGEAQPPT